MYSPPYNDFEYRPTSEMDRIEPRFLAPNDPDIPLLKYPVYNAHAFYQEGKPVLLNPWVLASSSTTHPDRSPSSSLRFSSPQPSSRSLYTSKFNRSRYLDDT